MILGSGMPQEKGMATYSSNFAWRIPWTESMGSQRVGHDRVTNTFHFQGMVVIELKEIPLEKQLGKK